MTKTYVIPDIHGRLDLLKIALARIDEDSDGQGGTVIFTGDYVDRGPESAGVVQLVMDGPTTPNWVWICLGGNHEDMMIDGLADINGMAGAHWGMNGGVQTLDSYANHIIPIEHIDWMKGLKLYHEDRYRVYVHAAVDPAEDLDNQTEHTLKWYRYPKGYNESYRGKHIVHGHTPMRDGPDLYPNRTNLDTGAFYTGRLVVGVFNDNKGGGPERALVCEVKP